MSSPASGSGTGPGPGPYTLAPREIQFELTHDDLVDAAMARAERSRSTRVFTTGVFAMTSLMIMMAAMIGGLGSAALATTILAIFGFAMFQRVIVPRIQREHISAMLRESKNLGLEGSQRVVIDEHGLLASNWLSEFRTLWIGVESVTVAENHVLINVGAGRNLVIPRRAFASDAALREFVETAIGLHQRALASGPLPRPALPPHTP